MNRDSLGDRMKENYENRTRVSLPRRTYTVIRVDGKAFHTLTRNCEKPFDRKLMRTMDETAIFMCQNIQGVKFAYVQSDEISLLLTDFESTLTSAWFDGNLQKMASIAAATATVGFNKAALDEHMKGQGLGGVHQTLENFKFAMFDARVFTIPDPIEVENYFIWRQQDASRNSVQMAARSVYSHQQCDNKNGSELQEMLHKKGINWNAYTSGERRGRCIVKQDYLAPIKKPNTLSTEVATRTRWVSYDGSGCDDRYETPIFTQCRAFLRKMIPRLPEVKSGETLEQP